MTLKKYLEHDTQGLKKELKATGNCKKDLHYLFC